MAKSVITSMNQLLLDRSLQAPRRKSDRMLYGSDYLMRNLDFCYELHEHEGCVNALEWSEDGRYLASGSHDTTIKLWDAQACSGISNEVASINTHHTRGITDIKFLPGNQNRKLISVAKDNAVRLIDLEYAGSQVGNKSSVIYENDACSSQFIATEDTHSFLTCCDDGSVRHFDLRERSRSAAKRAPLLHFNQPLLPLTSLAISPAMPYLFTTGGHWDCAFLHDRRMLRHVEFQWGAMAHLDRTKPTQLVRQFKSKSTGDSTATSLKFSRANPYEILASWKAFSMGAYACLYDLRAADDASPTVLEPNQVQSKRHSEVDGSEGTLSPTGTSSKSRDEPREMEAPDLLELHSGNPQEVELIPGSDEWSSEPDSMDGDPDEIISELEIMEQAGYYRSWWSPETCERASLAFRTEFKRLAVERELMETHQAARTAPRIKPKEIYVGHLGNTNSKRIDFFGLEDEYVISGSDEGAVFVWRRADGEMVTVLEASDSSVNVVAPNPHHPLFAASGTGGSMRFFQPFLLEVEKLEDLWDDFEGLDDYELRTRECGRLRRQETSELSCIWDAEQVHIRRQMIEDYETIGPIGINEETEDVSDEAGEEGEVDDNEEYDDEE